MAGRSVLVLSGEADSDQLRYVVGEDAQASARMRRETSEQDDDAWAVSRYVTAALTVPVPVQP